MASIDGTPGREKYESARGPKARGKDYRYELQFQLLEAFPDDPPSVDASWQSKGVEDLREAIRRLAAQKGRVDLGRGRTGLKTSNLVQVDASSELLLRRCDSVLSLCLSLCPSRVLASLPPLVRSATSLVESVHPVEASSAAGRAFSDSARAFPTSRECLLFHAFYLTTEEVRQVMAGRCQLTTDPRGRVALTSRPSLTIGFGSGLVLCRALLGVGDDGDGHHVLPLERVLPYCILRLKQECLPFFVTGYLEEKGHFLHQMMKLQEQAMAQQQQHSSPTGVAAGGYMSYLTDLKGLSMGASPASNDLSSAAASLPPKRSRTYRHQHKHHHSSGGHHHMMAASSVGASSITPFDLSQHFGLHPASGDALKDENCSICTFNLAGSGMYDSDDDGDDSDGDSPRQVAELKGCQHFFHPRCLMEMAKKNSSFFQCPHCKKIYGHKQGNQPLSASMTDAMANFTLPGFAPGTKTIVITYNVTPGIQTAEHPNPGRQFDCPAFPRVAYLPDDEKGQKVHRLLRRAFQQRLIFTVGRSTTSGRDNVVTWNDIHHKTQATPGEHGYPDDNYLDSVIQDLAQHGIAE